MLFAREVEKLTVLSTSLHTNIISAQAAHHHKYN